MKPDVYHDTGHRARDHSKRSRKKPVDRHPMAIALDDWLSSPQGQAASDTIGINLPPAMGVFLQNRLKIAFIAGYEASGRQ